MLSELNISISSETVAWYGAIVATFGCVVAFGSLAVSYLDYRRDRAHLKIITSTGRIYSPAFKLVTEQTRNAYEGEKLFIKAVNIGRRTVTISQGGFKLTNGKQLIIVQPINFSFPYELTEGKSIDLFFDKKEVIQELKEDNTKIRYAFFTDSTGRIFKKCFGLKKSFRLKKEAV